MTNRRGIVCARPRVSLRPGSLHRHVLWAMSTATFKVTPETCRVAFSRGEGERSGDGGKPNACFFARMSGLPLRDEPGGELSARDDQTGTWQRGLVPRGERLTRSLDDSASPCPRQGDEDPPQPCGTKREQRKCYGGSNGAGDSAAVTVAAVPFSGRFVGEARWRHSARRMFARHGTQE